MLASAASGVKKTHIMSKANLSSEQMAFYFNSLLHHSLIREAKDLDNNPIYRTTEKGIKFLQCCAQIKELTPSVTGTPSHDQLLFS